MGILAKKRFGQNFLHDKSVLSNILDVSLIDESSYVLEIGPGTGNLTEYLLKKAKKVYAFEIDSDLIPHLENRFIGYRNFVLYNVDFLNFNLDEFLDIKDLIVVSNLPYYITSPIIFKLLESNLDIKCMTFMMQEEVALRICAKSSSSDFGLLTAFVNTLASVSLKFRVLPSSFTPSPSVNSSVVTFKPKSVFIDKLKYLEFLKIIFQNKRKTLYNNLKNCFSAIELRAIYYILNLDLKVRAEELELDVIHSLFDIYTSIIRIDAFAKVNLFLNVLGINGSYHNLESIVSPIGLSDKLSIFKSEHMHYFSDLEISDDVVIRTRDLYCNTFNINSNFTICLNKNIPISSGLGGSSSCSSSLLVLLNKFFNVFYDLKPLALELGSDNLFFLNPTLSVLQGRGDEVEVIKKSLDLDISVFVPPSKLNSRDVYNKFDFLNVLPLESRISDVLEKLYLNDYSLLDNNLLVPAIELCPMLNKYIDIFNRNNITFYFSGSGPSFFFINLDKEQKSFLKSLDGFFYCR